MKIIKYLVVGILLLNINLYSNDNWVKQITNSSLTVGNVFFSDSVHGWTSISGSDTLLYTKNSGENWLKLCLNSTPIGSIFFKDTLNGWYGSSNQVFRTVDGGKKWQSSTPPGLKPTSAIMCVFFVSKQLGFCGTNGGQIYKSTDSGINWIEILSSGPWTNDIYFYNDKIGWIVGSNGAIYKTFDGGNTWLQQKSNVSGWLGTIKAYSDKILIACGGASVTKTTDGGNNWSDVGKSITAYWMNSVSFLNSKEVFLFCNNGYILSSIDGGETWPFSMRPTNQHLNCSYFTKNNFGWVTGSGGTILNYSIHSLSLDLKNKFLCIGSTFEIPYRITGYFGITNYFSILLSDSNGLFTNPVTIGRIDTNKASKITCSLPLDLIPDKPYKIKIVSSSPSIIYSDSIDVVITMHTKPTISGRTIVFSSTTEQYSSAFPNGKENLWNCIGGTIIGSKIGQSVEINWQTNGIGKVILEQTITATGCKNSDTLLVNVTSPGTLSLNVNSSASICSGDSVQIGNTNPAVGGLPPYRFKWTPNTDLNNDTLPNPIVYPKTLTKYSLTVKDSRDSTATAEVNVQVNPLPTPKITESKSNPTAGDTVTYSAVFPNGTDNKWNLPKGGQIIGVDNTKDVQIKWLETGNGLVTITQTITATGCKKSDTLSVNVLAPDKLIVFAGTDQEICERESIQLGSQNPASGGKPPFKFLWTPSTGLSNDTMPNPEATPLSTTTYTIRVTDSNGDTATSKVTITVNPLPKPKISGKNIVFLNAKESYSVPTVAGSTYNWFIENGALSGKDTDANISVTWDQNKTGKVKIVQTSDKGCIGYDSISVSVNAAGDCISTKDIAIHECYIIPGYETVKLGIVKFKNICEENVKIANVEFQSKSGQFTIKDTMPDILSILKPMNEAEFVVAFKPQTSGSDEAFITLQTDKGEIKTSKISSFAVQGNDKTSLTVLKIIPSIPKGKPGTLVDLAVKIIEAKNVDIKGSMAFITSISWNSQVLQYLGFNRFDGRVHLNSTVPPMFDINSYDFVIELEGNARTGNMQLAEINTKALLGAFPKTDLIFRDFKWLDTTIKAEILNDGVFELDLCDADGIRMMKLSTTAQIETLSPNPVTESAYMKYSLLEDGKTSISIINTLGITKKVLFSGEKKSGNYELIFSTEDLESGIYYLVMNTASGLYQKRLVVVK